MRRVKKSCKIVFHLINLIILHYLLSVWSVKKPKTTQIERFVADLKHILVWTEVQGLNEEGQKHFINNKCQHINCYLTRNRNIFSDLRYFDVILFNLQDMNKQVLPEVRGSNQKYIFTANDSAENYPVCNIAYDNFFNWTWTYRTDSPINYRFFSIFDTKDQELSNAPMQWIPNMKRISYSMKIQLVSKSKAAAIFLDKCQSKSNREEFIKILKQHLNTFNFTVDVFGECGDMKCKRKTMASCYWKIRKHYYFYLAFEDSFAYDYITNSVLNGYKHNAVPVVLGGAQFKKFLPPGSYLNAGDLGPKRLAEAITEAIQNKKRYHDFFRWKNHYIIKESPVLDACVLCEKLNIPGWLTHRGHYKKFRKWWLPNFESFCRKQEGYFNWL